jgi:hypothetical protein
VLLIILNSPKVRKKIISGGRDQRIEYDPAAGNCLLSNQDCGLAVEIF